MMFYYRADVFKVRPEGPDHLGRVRGRPRERSTRRPRPSYLTTFSAADPAGSPASPSRPAPRGGRPRATRGRSPSTTRPPRRSPTTGAAWSRRASSQQADVHPGVEQGAQRRHAARLGRRVWGPGVLAGNAARHQGKWAMAPLPQWNAGESATGNWGGSSTAVTADRKHHAGRAVRQLAEHRPDAAAALVTEGAVYPASTDAQTGTALTPRRRRSSPTRPTSTPIAAEIADRRPGFTCGPERQRHLQRLQATRSARRPRTSPTFIAALATMQTATVDDMKKHGFNVGRLTPTAPCRHAGPVPDRDAGIADTSRVCTASGATRRAVCLPAPARCCSPPFLAAAHRLRRRPEPAQGQGQRPRARRAHGTRSASGWSNYADALPTPSSCPAALGSCGYGAIVVPIMLGLALLFALLLDAPGTRLARFAGSRSSCRTRSRASSPRCSGASSTCPAVSPIATPATSSACPRRTCSAARGHRSVANIAVWGGIGFNMIVLYTALRAMPRRASTRPPGSTAAPSCRSPCASRCRWCAGADHDRSSSRSSPRCRSSPSRRPSRR